MTIDIAHAGSGQPIATDVGHHFFVQSYLGCRERFQLLDHLVSIGKRAKSDFGDRIGMHENLPGLKEAGQMRIGQPQMVDPDIRVG